MNGKKLIDSLAAQCVEEYAKNGNSDFTEKAIWVDDDTFRLCLSDKNEHHSSIAIKRGFFRAYHNDFFTDNSEGFGQTYHMGVVNIINKDSENNKEYQILGSPEAVSEKINIALKVNRHRLVNIEVKENTTIATLTPQRNVF